MSRRKLDEPLFYTDRFSDEEIRALWRAGVNLMRQSIPGRYNVEISTLSTPRQPRTTERLGYTKATIERLKKEEAR